MFLYANGLQFLLYFSFRLGLGETSGGSLSQDLCPVPTQTHKTVILPFEQKCEALKRIIPTGRG